jgi:hypothetical protein
MTISEHNAESLLPRFRRFATHTRPIPRVSWRILAELIDAARRALTLDNPGPTSALELELLAAWQHCRTRS